MTRENLLKLYDRLTGLVEKLPGGLQKPILQELVPIRQLFLEQRPARLLLLGEASPSAHEFLKNLSLSWLQDPKHRVRPISGAASERTGAGFMDAGGGGESVVETGDVDNGWRIWKNTSGGLVEVFDARGDGFATADFERGVARKLPDAVVIFYADSSEEQVLPKAMDLLAKFPRTEETPQPSRRVYVGLSNSPAPGSVERLRALLLSWREIGDQPIRVLPSAQHLETGDAICAFLPNEAKLEFANFASLRKARAEIAKSLLKSFTAVCGVIGMQPIPLADLPVLTTLQSLMVGLIAYTSGRKAGPRVVAEFCGAVGVSLGLGILLREGARALVKIVPGFGNAVSGLVAGAGTYAIGRAAIAYFIEEVPAEEARKLFQALRPRKDSFGKKKGKSLPALHAALEDRKDPPAAEERR